MANKRTVKAKKPAAGGDRLLVPQGCVTVRMYRHGLGDCFLLGFGTESASQPCYVLIDCGVHMRQDNGTERLGAVMEDVVAATNGKIHVVVATHEHADHLSGFVQQGSPFLNGRLQIEQFWVAWTEKVGDQQADQLRMKRGAAREAIQRAVEKLKQAQQPLADRIMGLMDFESLSSDMLVEPSLMAGAQPKKKPSSNEIALEFLQQRASRTRYCEPGEMLELPGVKNARAFTLGPPREQELLKRALPSESQTATRETYLAGRAHHQTFLAAPGLDDETNGKLAWVTARKLHEDLRHPFEERVRRSYRLGANASQPQWGAASRPETQAFYQECYFGAAEWRRIDGDWLAAAEELALDLDSDTNNTTLVLAFEWGDPGQGDVFLFAGDAQVGNWLSWRRQSYRAGESSMSADDLLRRTILYKVGHHGSHNATLKIDPSETTASCPTGVPFGLELMPSKLVAFIPVDRSAVAKPMPRPWHMPHPPMYRRLLDKSSGRVLRSDGLEPESGVGPVNPLLPKGSAPAKVPGMTNVEWREARAMFKMGRPCPLYYDITFRR